MKANELRIGNWIYSKIYGQELQMKSFFGLCNVEANTDLFKPIQLTEELLLKFGFKKCDLGGFSIKTDKYEYIEFNSVLFCWVNGTKKPIKYVHQLQNLYFALTSEELTINF